MKTFVLEFCAACLIAYNLYRRRFQKEEWKRMLRIVLLMVVVIAVLLAAGSLFS